MEGYVMKFIRTQDGFSGLNAAGNPVNIFDKRLVNYIQADLLDEVYIAFHDDDGEYYSVEGISYVEDGINEYHFGAFDTFAQAQARLDEIITELNGGTP